MANITINDKYCQCDEEVLNYILHSSDKIEELEILTRTLKKQVLDGEIHWHSQKQKRLLEKRRKEKYKQRIDKAIEYISHEWFKREQIGITHLSFSYDELQHILDILRGKDNE